MIMATESSNKTLIKSITLALNPAAWSLSLSKDIAFGRVTILKGIEQYETAFVEKKNQKKVLFLFYSPL